MSTEMPVPRRFGRVLLHGVGGSAVSQCVGIIGTLAMAAVLEIGQFGRISAILAVASICSSLCSVSLDRIGLVLVGEASDEGRAVAIAQLSAAACLLGGIAALLGSAAASVFGFGTVLAILTGILCAGDTVRSICADLPRLAGAHFSSALLSQSARTGIGALAATMLATMGLESTGLIAGAFALVGLVLGAIALARTRTHCNIGFARRLAASRSLIVQGVPLSAASVALMLINQADVIVASLVLGDVAAGRYALAVRVANALGTLLSIVNAVALPTVAKYGPEPKTWEPILRFAATAAFIPAVLAAAVMWVVTLSVPASARTLHVAAQSLQILVLGQVVNAATGLGGTAIVKAQRTIWLTGAGVASALLTLPMEVWMATRYGLFGLATASAAGLAAFNIGCYLIAWQVVGINVAPTWNVRARQVE